ncbi:hypothetical protein [Longimycelium tulufanense]|uniref:hypothetical protein n=1 Tax=Longimycelium tulufanense TaxID=907463 RepID=UPI001664296B|nr:hypothetical protein [Longimycelium tulufanense]
MDRTPKTLNGLTGLGHQTGSHPIRGLLYLTDRPQVQQNAFGGIDPHVLHELDDRSRQAPLNFLVHLSPHGPDATNDNCSDVQVPEHSLPS